MTTEQTDLIKKYKDFSNNLLTNVFNEVPHLRERKWTVKNDDYTFNLTFNDLEPEIQNGFYNRVKSTIVLNPGDLVTDLVNYIQDEGIRYIDQIASNHLLQLLLSKQMDRQLANGTELTYTLSTSDEKGTNSGTSHTTSTGQTKNTTETNAKSGTVTGENSTSETDGLNSTTGENKTVNNLKNSSSEKTTAQATDNTTQNNTNNPYSVTQNHGAQTATVDNNTTVSNNGSTKESGSTTTEVKANGPATNTTNNTYVAGDRTTNRLSFDGSTEDEVVTNPAAGQLSKSTQLTEATPSKTTVTPSTTTSTDSTEKTTGGQTTTTNAYSDTTDYEKQSSESSTNEEHNNTGTTTTDSSSTGDVTVTNNNKENTFSKATNKSDTTTNSTSDSTTTNNSGSTNDSNSTNETNSKSNTTTDTKTLNITNTNQLITLMNKFSQSYESGLQNFFDGMFKTGIFGWSNLY